jgi:hypothetical protein
VPTYYDYWAPSWYGNWPYANSNATACTVSITNTATNLNGNWPFQTRPDSCYPVERQVYQIPEGAWPLWVAQSGTATQVTDAVWGRWVDALASNGTRVPIQLPVGAETPEPERLRAMADDHLAVQRQIQEETRRIAGEQAEADRKAGEALAAFLDEEQQAQLARASFVVVEGSMHGRYRLYKSGGVRRVDDREREVESLCIHADTLGPVPREDDILAKLLAVQANEDAFRRTANITLLRVAA